MLNVFKIFILLILLSCEIQFIDFNRLQDLIHQRIKTQSNMTIDVSFTREQINAFQSYGFENPDTLLRENRVMIDRKANRYYAKRISHFPGEYEFILHEFQQDSMAYGYDGNGVILGKSVVEMGKTRYQTVESELKEVLEHLQIKPILSYDLSKSEMIYPEENRVQLRYSAKDTLVYTFQILPFRLRAVENMTSKSTLQYNQDDEIVHLKGNTFHLRYRIQSLEFGRVDLANFTKIPEGFTLQNSNPAKIESERISANMIVIKNIARDRNSVAYRFQNSVIILGAPIHDRFSKQVIDIVESQFPRSQIKAVYVTHGHSDHISGLGEYIKRDIPILADPYTLKSIQHFQKLRSVANQIQKIELDENDQKFGVHFYTVPNTHSKGQTFAYFKNEKMMYVGDFVEIPADNFIPTHMSKAAKTFLEFIKEYNLDYRRMIGHHRNANISPATIDQYLYRFRNE